MEQTFESRFLAARRAVIAARFQNLNAMQLEGVLTTQGPLLLLAGAGDRLVDPACSRRLARTWQVPLLEHAQAGHDLPLDDPDWVAHQASLFFSRPAASCQFVSPCPSPQGRVAPLVIGKGSDRALPDG